MNNIKSVFSVKDLENLSGVKAHTIRIWEKRYNLFTPDRDDNNIRSYTVTDLKKILSIAFLNNFGYKISKISKMTDEEMHNLTRQIHSEKTENSYAVSNLKFAMFNFDSNLFHSTYDQLAEHKTFEEIFFEVFIPLLNEIGLLWQTETLKPIHEHFISSLIKQKLFCEIELFQRVNTPSEEEVYVLFLPMNEIHDLGILFVNYLLHKNNKKVIYLGDNVPLEDLNELSKYYNKNIFLSYFTVHPDSEIVESYMESFYAQNLENTPNEFWVLGKQVASYRSKYDAIKTFEGIQNVMLNIS